MRRRCCAIVWVGVRGGVTSTTGATDLTDCSGVSATVEVRALFYLCDAVTQACLLGCNCKLQSAVIRPRTHRHRFRPTTIGVNSTRVAKNMTVNDGAAAARPGDYN